MSGKYSQKLLDHIKQSATDALKTVSKGSIRKTAEVTGDLMATSLTMLVLRKCWKLHHRIIQKQLQISMIKKYLKKHI